MHVIAVIIADETEQGPAFDFMRAVERIAAPARASVTVLVIGAHPRHGFAREVLAAGRQACVVASHPSLQTPVQPSQLLGALIEALNRLQEPQREAPTLVVFPAGSMGEELAARLAVRMAGVALGRCSTIEFVDESIIGSRPAFGGRVIVRFASTARLGFVAIRPLRHDDHDVQSSPAPASTARKSMATVHEIALSASLPASGHVEYLQCAAHAQRLEGAKLVVCGGRGIGSQEGFVALRALAERLGGALAGTLPAIDAGWLPVSHQVGQSGKYIAPDVYIAVGVSGTPQHMAGIDSATRIVAINKDPEAEIFKHAEIGVVADWRAIVPALMERFAQDAAPARPGT